MKLLFRLMVFLSAILIYAESNLEDFLDNSFVFQANQGSVAVDQKSFFTPEEILGFLTGIVRWQDIANKDFFLHTHEIPVRHVLDMPFVSEYRPCHKKSFFSITPWYGQINKLYCTQKDDRLEGYLALNKTTLLEEIRKQFEVIKLLQSDYYVDTDVIFGALKNAFVEQRRLGLLFDWSWCLNSWRFNVHLPFVYFERNFQMDLVDKLLLEKELSLTFSQKEQKEFQDAHLISDKLGFSDMRVHTSWNWYHTNALSLSTGLFTTLPTGFSITQGLRGSVFSRPSTYPDFNFLAVFDHLFDDTYTDEPQATFITLSSLGLDALDRLSANLLDMPLHNKRHGSIGCDFHVVVPFYAHDYTAHMRGTCSAEYLFPSNEKRFFINNVDYEGFAALDVTDPSQAVGTLTFLNDQSLERFFLRAFNVRVSPGFILKTQIEGDIIYKKWTFACAADAWIKTKEHIKLLDLQDKERVNQHKAHSFVAYQATVLGKILYTTNTCSVGFSLFSSIITQGIGNEYGCALEIQIPL